MRDGGVGPYTSQATVEVEPSDSRGVLCAGSATGTVTLDVAKRTGGPSPSNRDDVTGDYRFEGALQLRFGPVKIGGDNACNLATDAIDVRFVLDRASFQKTPGCVR
jgi:hypothetical protein